MLETCRIHTATRERDENIFLTSTTEETIIAEEPLT